MLGHFTEHEDFSLPSFIHTDETAAEMMASLVGASREEVAVMETLTANLHFLMSSFYRPTKEKYKIILEGKAFPSDHVRILVLYRLTYVLWLFNQYSVSSWPTILLIMIDLDVKYLLVPLTLTIHHQLPDPLSLSMLLNLKSSITTSIRKTP